MRVKILRRDGSPPPKEKVGINRPIKECILATTCATQWSSHMAPCICMHKRRFGPKNPTQLKT